MKYTTRMKINDIRVAVKDLKDNQSGTIIGAELNDMLTFLQWLEDMLKRKTINK